MAELADAPDLGSGGQTRAGSNPVIRTQNPESLYLYGSPGFLFSNRLKTVLKYRADFKI